MLEGQQRDGSRGDGGSQQPPTALCGAAATEQHFALHAAHLIVVVPGQFRAGPDPSAKG